MTKIRIEVENHHIFMVYGMLREMLPKIAAVDIQASKEIEEFLKNLFPQIKPYENDKYHPTWEDLK